jgi:3-methylcrotonyl-CoA carboxylase alpha subunit
MSLPVIERLLVANRGEIACRIFRTARRLGICSIAVFSDADAGALHVREADAAIRIGPAAARESYLDIERVLEAARVTGAQAIHPGYGFLAESAEFARACVRAGLVLVGPPPEAIAAMGSKSLAKQRARAGGIPVLPGYEGPDEDLARVRAEALKLGFPLMIKPASGGGGKGMQVVGDESELEGALIAARRLAASSFGEGALLIERYLKAPRHIEVQVFADAHGHVVHLGERDCSIQRRHQKLLEEAPAPGVPDPVRQRMRSAAIQMAREIGYVSAGTVEFLLDEDGFYFMEMNTRLQVEHTVTEAVTGLDLVEWQLRVAGGEPLPLKQEEIHLRGHAIEARVCAEDPEREFLPSAGTLRLMQWPQGEGLRVDAGFVGGDAVPASYDSLLGKVIAWAPSREEAIARLGAALEHTFCAGVRTNERWLARIVRSEPFRSARHTVASLAERPAQPSPGRQVPASLVALAALGVHAGLSAELPAPDRRSPWEVHDGFTPNLPAITAYVLTGEGGSYAVAITFVAGVPVSVTVGAGHAMAVADVSICAGVVRARLGDRYQQARFLLEDGGVHLWAADAHHQLHIEDLSAQELSDGSREGALTTPLPGVVASLRVKVGQRVAAGEVLMVIEAMKMEHPIKAPGAGIVRAIHFAQGERVAQDSELLELAPVESAAGEGTPG